MTLGIVSANYRFSLTGSWNPFGLVCLDFIFFGRPSNLICRAFTIEAQLLLLRDSFVWSQSNTRNVLLSLLLLDQNLWPLCLLFVCEWILISWPTICSINPIHCIAPSVVCSANHSVLYSLELLISASSV